MFTLSLSLSLSSQLLHLLCTYHLILVLFFQYGYCLSDTSYRIDFKYVYYTHHLALGPSASDIRWKSRWDLGSCSLTIGYGARAPILLALPFPWSQVAKLHQGLPMFDLSRFLIDEAASPIIILLGHLSHWVLSLRSDKASHWSHYVDDIDLPIHAIVATKERKGRTPYHPGGKQSQGFTSTPWLQIR